MTTTPAMPDLLREIVAYCREAGHDWSNLAEAEHMLATLQAKPAAPGVTGAVQTLIEALKADPEYAWAWHCNVAMAAVDEGLSHYQANKAAARFLSWLAQIDTTTHPGFPKAPAQPAEVSDAAMKDAVFEASIEFIGTLTGMQPPPIETAPPEVFKPFRDFTEKVCVILAPRMHASASAAGRATPQADPLNPGWCVGCAPENCIGCGIGLNEPRRSILALRPQTVPMTLAEVSEAHIKAPYTSNDSFYSIFSCGIRAAEAHHGITAPAGGEVDRG